MTLNERKELYLYHPKTNEPMCYNCKYFYQHYIQLYGYKEIAYGHCVESKSNKTKRTYDVCEHHAFKKGGD